MREMIEWVFECFIRFVWVNVFYFFLVDKYFILDRFEWFGFINVVIFILKNVVLVSWGCYEKLL